MAHRGRAPVIGPATWALFIGLTGVMVLSWWVVLRKPRQQAFPGAAAEADDGRAERAYPGPYADVSVDFALASAWKHEQSPDALVGTRSGYAARPSGESPSPGSDFSEVSRRSTPAIADVVARRPRFADAPPVDWLDDEAPETRPSARRGAARRPLSEVQAEWNEGATDSAWTAQMDVRIAGILDDLNVDGEVRNVDCRDTLCKLSLRLVDMAQVLNLRDAGDGEQWVELHRSSEPDGPVDVYVYVAREHDAE